MTNYSLNISEVDHNRHYICKRLADPCQIPDNMMWKLDRPDVFP